MSYRTKVIILIIIIGYAAAVAGITTEPNIWIFILALVIVLMINIVLWVEARSLRWQLKVFKRKTFEILRNLNKFENPHHHHNESSLEKEIADFYGSIGRQIKKSFQIEKQFTQNASHELQTPITVIKTSIDSLLQSENLTEENFSDLEVILKNTNKLSKINNALVLLSRIKSYYNDNVEYINVNKLVDGLVDEVAERLEFSEITLTKEYDGELNYEMNGALCEIMISNLLSNAIKHNKKGGNISIIIKDSSLRIKNTGTALTKKPEELFERFAKDSTNPDSLGLGLSIIKMICDYSNLQLDYYHNNGIHELVVKSR